MFLRELIKNLDYGSIIFGGLGFNEQTVLLYQAGFNTLAFGCGIIGTRPAKKLIYDAMARFRLSLSLELITADIE